MGKNKNLEENIKKIDEAIEKGAKELDEKIEKGVEDLDETVDKEVKKEGNYLVVIIPVLCVAVVALIAFFVIKMRDDTKEVIDVVDPTGEPKEVDTGDVVVPETADPSRVDVGPNDTEYQYIDNFTSVAVFDNLSYILDNTIGQHVENDRHNIEEALSINGNILRNDRYNVEFAFQYGNYKNYANYLGEEFTNRVGGYSLSKADFQKVYKKVYGIDSSTLGDNFYEDGYYNSSMFTNYVDINGYRFVEVSSEKNSSNLITVTAKVYNTIVECLDDNDNNEEYCNNHGKKIGSIIIEYLVHNGNYIFKSISLFDE